VIGQQPGFHLTNRYSKRHESAGGWKPLSNKKSRALEVLVQVDHDEPGIALRSGVVAWQRPPEIRLAALDLDSMHFSASAPHDAPQNRLV
jgi:hypothetical protein